MRETVCRSWYSRHVDADHRVLVVEHVLGQRLRQLRLADAGRAEEDEAADRPLRVLQAAARAADGVGRAPRSRASWPMTRSCSASSMCSSFSASPSSMRLTGMPVI